MKRHLFNLSKLTGTGLRLGALLLVSSLSAFAAASLNQQISPTEVNLGDAVSITLTVENGSFKQKASSSFMGMILPNPEIALPQVDGLQSMLSSSRTTSMNGVSSATVTFTLLPSRAGDYTVPAFDVPLRDGSVLRAREMKFHVLSSSTTPPATVQTQPVPPQPPPSVQNFNPNGPVVYPNNNQAQSPAPVAPVEPPAGTLTVPTEGGRPAKVFIGIKPQTTDAYVGESIPVKIEFYIRGDSIAQQDSLPTIKGSDFLMNSLSTRPHEDEVGIMGEAFLRNTWNTSISAPKSGDFPFQMQRDTYWQKSNQNSDPYTNFFPGRPNLAHEMVGSNQTVIHVHTLPDEGRPANFTGAIGQFTVTGSAAPQSVAVGEPVTLHFTVAGEGNFDYVRCPTLPDDPAWKAYVPSSKIEYQDESHTQGTKTFEMAIIPKKNATVPLPQASFSYFDPDTKKYNTLPIDLPPITVTGSMPSAPGAPVTADGSATTAAAAPPTSELRPNRVDPGSLQTSFRPIYWQPWFWAVQGGFLSVLALGGLFFFLRSRKKPDTTVADRLARQQALDHEVDAMSEAVKIKDAHAFFIAARHAVQLHLGTEWNVKPETLTLSEIRLRDPELAQSLEPLFLQTDEIVYSGGTAKGLDLAHWGRHVSELLQTRVSAAKS